MNIIIFIYSLEKNENIINILISINFYRGSVDRINTEMMETALKQLKGLKEYLATKVDVANRNAFELVTLVSMATQVNIYNNE